jgi:hypothetical protein
VKPTVGAALAQAEPFVDAGVDGSFFDAGDAAIELVDVYARRAASL